MHPDFDLSSQIHRFEEQYARNPDSLIFARLADLHRKAGSPRQALEVLEEGLERHPDYLSAHIVRARALQALDRHREAESAYRRVLELDGQNLVALRALAELARGRGDLSEARARYERLLQADPRNDQARLQLRKLSREASAPASESGPEADPSARGDEERRGGADASAPEGPGPGGHVEPADDREELADEVRRIVAEVRERFGRRGAEDAEEARETGVGGTGGDGGEDCGPPADARASSPDEAESDARDETPASGGADPAASGAGGEPDAEAGAEGSEEELVTETLAQLYASQGFYEEAIEMYEEMRRERPDDPELRKRLSAVRARARGEEPEEEPPPLRRRPRPPEDGGGGGEAATTRGEGPLRARPSRGRREADPDVLAELTEEASPVPSEAPTPTARQHLQALLRGEAIPGYANQLLREARRGADEEG